jgi:hypothetical protein
MLLLGQICVILRLNLGATLLMRMFERYAVNYDQRKTSN